MTSLAQLEANRANSQHSTGPRSEQGKARSALNAVRHWKIYLKLDASGPWAEIARRQLDKLRQATLIHSR